MTERIDHAAEARRIVDSVSSEPSANVEYKTGQRKADTLAEAQVHATLALVEQQRIANRIALASAVAQASRSAGMHGSVLGLIVDGIGLFDNPSTEHGAPPLHEDIREGLGL